MRADENGCTRAGVQPSGASRAAATAARVALGAGSARLKAPRAAAASASSANPRGSIPASEISPVVMVPVLSKHSVSTRASSSTEASSLARARRRARASTPAMNDRLVSSTKPSGTMATAAATVPRSASCQRSSVPRRRNPSRAAAGGIITVSQRRITFTPRRSSLPASLNRLASAARRAA